MRRTLLGLVVLAGCSSEPARPGTTERDPGLAPIVRTASLPDDVIGFDARACVAGDGRGRDLGAESHSLLVVGCAGEDCLVEETFDQAERYQTARCRVPRSRGLVRVKPGTRGQAGTCGATTQGTVGLSGRRSLARRLRLDAARSVDWFPARVLNVGEPLALGDQVAVRVSVWPPTRIAPDLTSPVLGPPTATRDVSLVLGRATFGAAIDEAIMHGPVPLTGGTRLRLAGLGAALPEPAALVGGGPDEYVAVELELGYPR